MCFVQGKIDYNIEQSQQMSCILLRSNGESMRNETVLPHPALFELDSLQAQS